MNSIVRRRSRSDLADWLPGVILIACAIFFGGASRLDVLAPIVPRLASIVILGLLIWKDRLGFSSWTLPEKLLWAMLLLVPLVQLIPLPWELWTILPGRDYPRQLFETLTMRPWSPISMTPTRTVNAFLALLPGLAMYAMARTADARTVDRWWFAVIICGVISAVLGLMQVVAGEGSGLRLYRITNVDASVGLFSNANHHSSFLVLVLLLLLYQFARLHDDNRARGWATAAAIYAVAALALATSVVASLSNAGLLLMLALGGLVGALLALNSRLPLRWIVAIGAVGLCAAFGAAYYVLGRPDVDGAFQANLQSNGRVGLIPLFGRIIADHFPFGTGMGSFDAVFRSYETPASLSFNYLNNAHNDYAQLLIEGGLLALIGLVAFFYWWASRAWLAWFRKGNMDPSLRIQAQVASIGSGMLILHSLADYPLRTAASSVLFAMLCALMARSSALKGQSSFEKSLSRA